MARFMNAELIAIRDAMRCGHCSAIFKGSDSQAWTVKYKKTAVYCSGACRQAAVAAKLSKPIPNRGACPTCGNVFFSRTAKLFCSMACYTGSAQFLAMITANRTKISESGRPVAHRRTGEDRSCLQCSEAFYARPSSRRRFCSKPCYRTWMADRFDRWVANPEGMALPQAYDEFLDREELTCIVEGCGWVGRHLSLHVNQVHGIPAADFKRAAGFNLQSGIIARPLAEAYSARAKVGVALTGPPPGAGTATRGRVRSYQSKEGAEHRAKALALTLNVPGPTKTCLGCSKAFTQRHRQGRTLYCTTECRDETYARNRKLPPRVRVRGPDGRYR